jgi:D-3-phosphoglycerate dehydrogenase / 2-oxoglutarate reductase
MKLKILLMGDLAAETISRLQENHQILYWRDQSQVPSLDPDVDLVVVRSPHRLSQEVISSLSALRWIIRAGSGTDNIDMAAVSARGIRVFTTPLSAIAVAELAFALLLALVREIIPLHASLQRGNWEKNRARGEELAHKTIGIVGFGKIGQHVAKIAAGFDMQILACDRTPDKPEKQSAAKRFLPQRFIHLDQLLSESEVIVLCCPLNSETLHLIDATRLRNVRQGAILINVARGGLVDERALRDAVESGHLAGAGIDSFESEPCTASVLLGNPRIITTPHIGAQTRQTWLRIGREVERLIAQEIDRNPIGCLEVNQK